MTLLAIGLGIAVVALAALWMDERLTRQSTQKHAEFWREKAMRHQDQPEPARVPFGEL